MRLTLTPAYGVRYGNTEEVLNAWYSGKDFKIIGGPYCSCRDIDKLRDLGHEEVWIRHSSSGPFEAVQITL